MSRNSFDEGDDKITPLGRTFTTSDEGHRVLQMGNMAAARRKSSISRNSLPKGLENNINNTSSSPSPSSKNSSSSNGDHIQIPSELPARTRTTAGGVSRSKSMKKALGRAMSTRATEPHKEHTISNSGFAPSRSKSLRAPPPPRLALRRQQEGKKGAAEEPIPVPDFPSPGRAPRGQRIFDPQTIAEDEGVIIEKMGGWAVDKKTQKKLDDERARIEEQERQNVFSGDDGDIKHNKTGRERSKSFKEFFKRG